MTIDTLTDPRDGHIEPDADAYRAIRLFDGSISADLVLRVGDKAIIPRDPENADWRAFQAWKQAREGAAS